MKSNLNSNKVYSDVDKAKTTKAEDLALLQRKSIIDQFDILDLTNLNTYTIDDNNTFEIDDAISLDINYSKVTVWIHKADPSSLIQPSSEIDLIARERAVSLYLGDKVVPMLPKMLVEKIMSLKVPFM